MYKYKSHSPEPWKAEDENIYSDDEASVLIATVCLENLDDLDIAFADARRIAACVNACAGLTTEAIEGGVIGELISALEEMIQGRVLTESRDAVHPSRRFCKECGRNSWEAVHFSNCCVLAAENALAKVRGVVAQEVTA